MAVNPFDEAVAEQAQAAPAGAPPNPYDAIVNEHRTEQNATLRTTVQQAATQAPDRAADTLKLADRYGLPASVVESNLEAFQTRAQLDDASTVAQHAPALGAWLAKNPAHAAVAHDDLEGLGTLEWLVTAPQRAFAQQVNQLRYSELRFRQINGETLSRADQDKLATYKYHSTLGGDLGAGATWAGSPFRKAVRGLYQLVAQGIEPLKYGVAGAAETGAAGAVVGTALPVIGTAAGALAGAGYGMKAGLMYGVFKTTAQQESTQAYDELLEMKDEHGQPLDPGVVRVAALAVGGLNGLIEQFGLEKFLQSVPGLNKLAGGASRVAMKQALLSPTVRAAFGQLAKTYAGTLTSEVAQEVAQRAVALSAEELAKAAPGRRPVPGQLAPGNVNLFQQPAVPNADGSVSTVDSLSVNLDGREVLLPTVTPDGRHFTGTEEERTAQAVAEYQRTGRHLGMFKTPEAATTFAQQLHEDYAAGAYDRAAKFRTPTEWATELGQEAGGAVTAFALGVAGGPVLSLAHNVARAQQAKGNTRFFQELGKGVTDSKTFARLPHAAQDFIAAATKDGPLESLYAPVDTWATYWQDKGLDPAAVAAEVTGSAEAYDTAIRTGEDLVIPTARYAVKLAGTEHNTFFADELRLAPDAMNQRESDAFETQQMSAAEAGLAPTPADIAGEHFRTQLEGAGVPAHVATHYAALQVAVYGTAAIEEGIDPTAMGIGLGVTRPDLASASVGTAPTPAAPPAATARFLGYGLSGPLYTVAGGASDRSTLSAADLEKLGIAVPETPADTGDKLTGAELRARALDPAFAAAEAEAAVARVGQGTPAQSGTKARLQALGHTPAAIDVMSPAEVTAALRVAPPASGRQIPGARPVADYAPSDLAHEAQRVADMQGARRAEKAPREGGSGIILDTGAAGAHTTGAADGAPQSREVVPDGPGQRADADQGGHGEGAGPGARVESGGLQAGAGAIAGLPELDEVFAKRPLEETTARLTPAVRQHLASVLEELENFPTVGRTWHWLGDTEQKTGNAAGGAADIIGGTAGTKVASDVLAFSPVNRTTSGRHKGEPARKVHGTRADVEAAVRAVLETGDVRTNLQEGALRVAEQRAAGDWSNLASGGLPNSWGEVAPEAFTNALSEAIDLALQPTADLLADDTAITDEALEHAGDGETSFTGDEFDQAGKPADLLDTGETQPRLPGDVGDVREAEVATPQLEAPFSLTSEVAKPSKTSGQTELFQQTAYHGTAAAPFDRFSLQHIGSGQGANSYGWGLYFASLRSIADRYREELAGKSKPKHLAFKSPDSSNIADGDIFQSGGLYHMEDGPIRLKHGLNELYSRVQFVPAGPAGIEKLRTELERTVENYTRAQAEGRTLSLGKTDPDQLALDRYRLSEAADALAALNHYGAALEIRPAEDKPGNTYTVQIPENDDFLFWDKPLSEQSPKVQAALEALGFEIQDIRYPSWAQAQTLLEARLESRQTGNPWVADDETIREGLHYVVTQNTAAFRAWWGLHGGEVTGWGNIETAPRTGEQAYTELRSREITEGHGGPHGKIFGIVGYSKAAELASRKLNAHGVAGIRYLDAGSRDAGEGSSNYVVFDDALVSITEFDQPLLPEPTLDAPGLQAFVDAVKAREADLVEFDLRLLPAGDIQLETIAARRGSAAATGSRAMTALTRFADQHGTRIVLSLADKGYQPHAGGKTTSSRSRLREFYKRFGFVDNRGRTKDYRLSIYASMYREPTLRGDSLDLGQPVLPAPPFYSRLTRAVEASQLAKASGAQWQATIANSKLGINKDEFALAHVDDLAAGTVYTQQEVLDYLAANAVTVETVTLGEDQGPTEAAVRERAEALYDARLDEEIARLEENLGDGGGYYDPEVEVIYDGETQQYEASVDGDDLGEWFDTKAEAQDAAAAHVEKEREKRAGADEDYRAHQILLAAREQVDYEDAERDAREELTGDDDALASRYGEYVLPGGDEGSYREVFLTVPQIGGTEQAVLAGISAEERRELLTGGWAVDLAELETLLAAGRQAAARVRVGAIVAQLDAGQAAFHYTGVVAMEVARQKLLFQKLEQDLTWRVAPGPGWNDGHDEYSGIDNPIVRLRFNTRTAVDGARVLFLEEAQPPHADEQAKMPALLTKNWRPLAFKWALRHAAEQGLAAVVWTTGQQQADRYPGVEAQVRAIGWEPILQGSRAWAGGGRVAVDIQTHAGRTVAFTLNDAGVALAVRSDDRAEFAGKAVAAILGQEIAATIASKPTGQIAGEGLRMGGEGLKRLYDVDFRNVVNGLPVVKRTGGTVESFTMGTGRTVAEIDAEMNAVNRDAAAAMTNAVTYERDAAMYAGAIAELQTERNQAQARGGLSQQPGVRLTPALTEAVLGGQALFQDPPALFGDIPPPITETPAFRSWFGASHVVDPAGQPLRVYHGTRRLDRFGPVLRASRATSGPMPFFTANRDIASNYATNKSDTSLDREEGGNYEAWFRLKVGRGATINLDRAWHVLTAEQRATIAQLAPRVATSEDGQGRIELRDEGHDTGTGGYDQHILEARGNHFKALIEEWLNSANLFDQERAFLEVLALAGAPVDMIEFHDPHADKGGVAAVYLAIQRPLRTDQITDAEVTALEQAARRQRRRPEVYGADMWDKAMRDPREWVAALQADRAAGVNSFVWSSIPDWVTRTLQGLGYDGIHDTGGKTGGTEHDVWIPFTAGQVKSATGNRGTFDPTTGNILKQGDKGQPRRGSIRFGPDRQFLISLFERADLSTALHELGHFFLEVQRDLAARPEASPRITADMATLRAWWAEAGAVENVDQHELYARAFEAYLMEGKAPSLALRTAFSHFRAWLIGVYHSLVGLKVNLTPEVRQVFDRMLATDRALAEAAASGHVAPLFLTAAMAGMSDTQFGLYRSTVENASRVAREQLEYKLLAEVQRVQTTAWRHQHDEIRETVAAAIQQQPVYQALAAIRRGRQPDGAPLVEGLPPEPLKLSRALIVERYGPERLAALPTPYLYTRAGGLDPDVVAPLFGFSSGDELLTAATQAEPMQAAIDRETGRRMIAEHGSLLLDGTLHAAAQAAVVNDERDVVLRAELKALNQLRRVAAPFVRAGAQALAGAQAERAYERRWFEAEARLRIAIAEGQQQVEIDALAAEVRNLRATARGGAATIRAGIPSAALLKDTAQRRLAATVVRDVKPERFWSAARRASDQATAAAARQDFAGAITAKQQELINVALYREAVRVEQDSAARVTAARALGSAASRARLGKAGGSYLAQVEDILDRYNFATLTRKRVKSLASLREWAAGLEAAGLPVELPAEVLDQSRRTHYSELTVEQLVGITDGLNQIVHLARLKNTLLKASGDRDYRVVRDGLEASIRAHNPARPIPLEFRSAGEKWRHAADWFASHAKLALIASQLDGNQDGGAVWDAFVRPINAAADLEETRSGEVGAAYAALLERFYPGRELLTFNDTLFIPAIHNSLSKEARLTVAMNWGNQTSRDRVLADPLLHWSLPQVQAVLDTLDERDWRFVQAHWDYLNTFWPEIAAKEERVTGLAPEKVEALPVTTKFGEFPGGYHPLVYDARKEARVGAHEVAAGAKLQTGAYVRTTTRRGHVEARQQRVTLPLRLDMTATTQHLAQVIHDLTHHEMLIDTTRLLRDPKIAHAIYETRGDIVYKKLARLLEDIALGASGADAKPGLMDTSATWLRTRSQLAGMAWNLWTALQQPIGLFNGMERVGVTWVARGLGRWLRDAASLENTAAWINAVSPMMRKRAGAATQDLREVRQTLRARGGWFDVAVRTVSRDSLTQQTILDSYLWHIGLAQRVADIPTWLGQYEKAMAGGEAEDRAIALADQAVLDSQGGGQIKDLAEVQRGGPVAKLFMTFYSYANTVHNATARAAGRTNFRSPASVATFMGHLALLYAMPAIATTALAHLSGRVDGDDPKRWLTEVAREMLATALNTMIVLREVSSGVLLAVGLDPGARGYEGPAGTRPFQLFDRLAQQVHQGHADVALAKAANAAAGVLFRYPALQVQRSIEGFVALEEGRTTNPLALLMGAPRQAKGIR